MTRAYGKIECGFWDNRKVKTLSDQEKLFLCYLFSCRHKNTIGTYMLPVGYIATDLVWSPATVSETVTLTVSKGYIEYDYDNSIVRIVSWFEHNMLENPNVAKKAISFFDALPECQLKYNCYNDLSNLGGTHVKPLLEPFRNRFETISKPRTLALTLTQPIKPLLPSTSSVSDPVDNFPPVDKSGRGEGGVLKSGNGKAGGYDIIAKLSPDGLEAAKKAAPGWDIYHLAKVYNEGVPERGEPAHPDKAFPAWCGNYTKGKQP